MSAQPGAVDRAVRGQVAIRHMRPRHLRGVLAIEQVVYPRPWSEGLFRQELAAADRTFLVAMAPGSRGLGRTGAVVAYGGIQMIARDAHIVTVASHPAWRRVGIGARMVLELLGAAAERGAEAVTLEVRDSNHAARALYAAFGFEDEGARPGYYADNREDARILWLHRLPAADVRAGLVSEGRRRRLPVPPVLTRPA